MRPFFAGLMLLCLAPGVLAADAPMAVGFLGTWQRSMPLIDRAARETGLSVKWLTSNEVIGDEQALDDIGLLLVLNLDAKDIAGVSKALGRTKASNPSLAVVSLDKRDVHATLLKAGLLRSDPKVQRYWRANGLSNMKRLLNYVAATYLNRPGAIEPPVPMPDAGYYDPSRSEPFDDFATYRAFKIAQNRWADDRPVAVMMIQQSFWITEDTKVIDAQAAALEKRGINVAVVFADTHDRLNELIRAARPDVLIEDRHGGNWPKDALESLDVPYLRPISMLGSTIDQWRQSPRGMAHRDVGLFMTVQESKSTIEPVVVGGLKASVQGFRVHEPIADRIERFADRTKKWLDLRAKKNADKRIAIIYYNKSLGKDDLLRGSPTGAFLDGPESLIRFLPALKAKGYAVDPLPQTAAELLGWVKAKGRNIGPWARAELDQMVVAEEPVLIPLAKYEAWFNAKLSDLGRQAVLKHHGPPPGKLMVVNYNSSPHIVLPRIELGNILLAPQPERGEKQDDRLIHSRDVPPPHNYLAFYWWLEEEHKPDAVVHWGTHGTLELLPGKEAGLSADCWSDVCVGTLPVVNLWIMDNLGEATISRRRSYALLSDHMVPALVNAGLTDDLRQLHDDIDKFDGLEPGLLKEEFRKNVTAAAKTAGVMETLLIDAADRQLSDDEIGHVAEYLHEVYESTTPTRLHVLGQPPPEQEILAYLVNILRRSFLDHLAAVCPVPKEEDRFEGDKYKWLRGKGEELLRTVLIENQSPAAPMTPELENDLAKAREILTRLRDADQEIAGLLHGLDGGFLRPGPGPDPIRNPGCLPGGRNLYTLNPEEVPTRPSWEVAVKLIDDLLKQKQPRKVGIDLNGMNTMRDFGVTEAQAMYLMGVRPVWDENNLAVDVELIPHAELRRPRVDVLIAMGGMYKENFPTRVKLLDKAIRLASAADEPQNLVRQGSASLEARLIERGFASARARELASARIFGAKPGNMSGTGILHLVPRSGVWESADEIADVYIDHMSYAYTGDVWGEKIEGLYAEAVQGTDTMIRVWASNMTSPLSNHHAYEYLGGMNMALKKLTGRTPDALIADVRQADVGRMRRFEEVLATGFRAELLNRKWLTGMMEHDYAGAGHIAELTKNSFGWSVTRPGSVTRQLWNEIHAVYVKDKFDLGLSKWFDEVNPHARQEVLATLLEASRIGVWKTDDATRRNLAREFAESVIEHGDSAGLVSGGNVKLEREVDELLNAPGESPLAELANSYRQELTKSSGVEAEIRNAATSREMPALAEQAAQAKPELVSGDELAAAELADSSADATGQESRRWLLTGVMAAAVCLVAIGAVRRKGAV